MLRARRRRNRRSIRGTSKKFFLLKRVHIVSEAHTASYSMGTGGKTAGFPFSADVMNNWSHTSTPPHVFMAWCLIKHSHNFTVTFQNPNTYKIHQLCTVIL
jgi:hypothetical protein